MTPHRSLPRIRWFRLTGSTAADGEEEGGEKMHHQPWSWRRNVVGHEQKDGEIKLGKEMGT